MNTVINEVLVEIVIILGLIFLNGILSMSEMAIISSRKARLQNLAESGDKGGAMALAIASEPASFLATVQIGITLVGILAGAFGGITIAEEIAAFIKQMPPLAPNAEAVGMTVVVSLITLLSLIFGELIPKQIALQYPERIARTVAKPMHWLAILAAPLVRFLSGTTNFVLRLCGLKDSSDPPVTQAEIHVLVEQATEAGEVEESEQEMVTGVLELDDRRVTSLMTPKSDIVWLSVDDTPGKMLERIGKRPHSHMPVARGNLDHLLGVVEAQQIMLAALAGDPDKINLETMVSQPIFVPENATALQLLARFKEEKHQIALVIDEYGGLMGIVTRDDIFQAIAGDLPLLNTAPKWEIVQIEDYSWLIDGQIPMEEFQEVFSVTDPAGGSQHYHTLAGFIIRHLETIPSTGDKFRWQGLSFEIVDMDRHRIDKVLVEKLPDFHGAD